jgi:type IV pilus assembly protein PilC
MSGFLQRDNEVRNKVKGAMTYPLVVLGFATVVVLGLFIFVISPSIITLHTLTLNKKKSDGINFIVELLRVEK